jgi:AraC-like DNA-binding protein
MIVASFLLTVLISFILVVNHWRQNKGVLFLVLLILAGSLRNLNFLIFHSKEQVAFDVYIYTNFDPFFALGGPCIYLYLRSMIKGKLDFNPRLLLHLIPALLVLLNTIPYYLLPLDQKIAYVHYLRFGGETIPRALPYVFSPIGLQKILITLLSFVYFCYAFFYVYQNKRHGSLYLKKKLSVLLNKMMWVLGICGIINLVSGAYIVRTFTKTSTQTLSPYYFLVLLVLPLSFFLLPNWLYGEERNKSIFERLLDAWRLQNRNPSLSGSESVEKTEDLDHILKYIDKHQPFLQETFSLHDLSTAINIPHVRLTNCFNKELNTSFPTYRNKLRIDYAVALLSQGLHHSMSIEGVGSKAGFKSKSAFYNAFKSVHGITPTDWIKENL